MHLLWVENILHNKLGMSQVSAQWVPQFLTPDQKHIRLVMSQANLALFEADPAVVWNISLSKGNIHILPVQKRPRWCHWQGRWWPPSSGMQMKLCSFASFRKAKLSRGNIMPTCWDKCKRQSSQNGLENWQRASCFTGTMAAVRVLLNWLIALNILLIWLHLTIFCSPTWTNSWLGSTIGQMMRSYLLLRTWVLKGWGLLYHRNPSAATSMEENVWTTGETAVMLKNKPYLVKFNHWHHG